jgi:hypothetical protein
VFVTDLDLKPMLTREGLPSKNIDLVARLGLSQAEITGDEEHHHNNTHNVENIVHVSFSFLSRDRITVEPNAYNITQRKRQAAVSLVVLSSDEAQRDLKFSDIIRIGVLYLVYACKPLL